MAADFLILGQGLAGTMLAWEFERAGISFEIVDAGHERAASRVAAGIINPITGRRLVPSWRVESLLPVVHGTYRELEAELGVPLWREMRVWRRFADDRERRVLAEKRARGELGAFAGAATDEGFWIEGAARIDLAALLSAARERWQKQNRVRSAALASAELATLTSSRCHDLVIDCTGVTAARAEPFAFVPWEFSKGEIIAITFESNLPTAPALDPDVILNDGHWLVPVAPGIAWVGATHEPGVLDSSPTATGRQKLEAAAQRLLVPSTSSGSFAHSPNSSSEARRFSVTDHTAGIRVNLPDKRPVAGRHPDAARRLGLINGLGAKGALYAPMLARQWVNHLTEGVPFDAEIAVTRFLGRNSSQASSQ